MDKRLCEQCGASFDGVNFQKHLRKCKDKRQLKCDQCEKSFIGKKKLENHQRMHKTVECRHCQAMIPANSLNWKKNGGKRSNLKHFGSCEFPPVYLRKNQEDMPTILLFPPAPLHINLLGAASDAIENGEEKFPVEFKDEFYPKFNLKKSGEGVGGKFAGPSIKKILEQEVLNELESVLPNTEYAQDLTDYLKTVRNLHQMCTAKDLKDYDSVIEDFRKKFMVMFEKHDLSWTLKIHVILDRYSFCLKKKQENPLPY